MPRLHVSFFRDRPLLDIASYARRGLGRRDQISPAEMGQIARTVGRAPEVMVKVLTRGSTDIASVRKHIDYIDRHGHLPLETDDGQSISSREAGRKLVDDWDLDLDEDRGPLDLSPAARKAPKVVHKLILSMPPGTPPDRVLKAARGFLREEFALKHRYAFALHTDEPHPHVHAVIKAISEQGERLYIKKATLRHWRSEFARHLRAQGVEANATERAVRGQIKPQKADGIYRAVRRGQSRHTNDRVQAIAAELQRGRLSPGPGKFTLLRTRQQIVEGWRAVSELLIQQGQPELGGHVRRFVGAMAAAHTEKEQIGAELLTRLKIQICNRQPTR